MLRSLKEAVVDGQPKKLNGLTNYSKKLRKEEFSKLSKLGQHAAAVPCTTLRADRILVKRTEQTRFFLYISDAQIYACC